MSRWRIDNTHPQAKHRLRVDLVSCADAGCETVRVVLRIRATTTIRPFAFVDDGSRNSCNWMNRSCRKRRRAPVSVLQICHVVVSQAVVQREFPRHLPRILRINPDLLFAPVRKRRLAYSDRIHLTQKEAGKPKADIHALDSTILEGLSGLRCTENVIAGCPGKVTNRIIVKLHFGSELVRVVIFDPSDIRVGRRPLRHVIHVVLPADIDAAAGSISCKESGHGWKEFVGDAAMKANFFLSVKARNLAGCRHGGKILLDVVKTDADMQQQPRCQAVAVIDARYVCPDYGSCCCHDRIGQPTVAAIRRPRRCCCRSDTIPENGQFSIGTNSVINLDRWNCRDPCGLEYRKVVVDQCVRVRSLRSRIVSENLCRHRVKAARVDLITWKWIADQQAIDCPRCGRIINHAFDHRTS